MKRMLITLAGLTCMALTPAHAGDAFSEMASLRTSFQVHPDVRGLSVEEINGAKGVIFRPQASETSVLVYGPVKAAQILPIDKASVEFLVAGRGSVGLYLRGKPELSDRGAYLALLNIGAKGKSTFRLFKHSIWPQTPPDDDLVARQELRSVTAERWYRLSFEVSDEADGAVALKATLSDAETDDELGMLEMKDIEAALGQEGQVALRIYSERRTEGEVQLLNLNIQHPGPL